MAVIPRHHRAHDFVFILRDQEQLRLNGKLGRDSDLGAIVRRIVRKRFSPKRIDAAEVDVAIAADDCQSCLPWRT
jgi:hypothetical protein